MKRYYTTAEAERILGISYITLWKWIKQGKIKAVKSPSGRWLIPAEEIDRLSAPTSPKLRAVLYARVSSHKQKEQGDLDRQVEVLKQYASKMGYEVVATLTDVGSGLKEDRPGLKKLFKLVTDKRADVVLVAHRDRLTRFGYKYLQYFFDKFGVQIVEVEPRKKEPLEELIEDFVEIVVSFAGRIYGMRSHYAKRLVEQTKKFLQQTLKQKHIPEYSGESDEG